MPRRFGATKLCAIDAEKYLRIRAGDDHRFIAVWVVVVDGRAFVRSWQGTPGGWFDAFLELRRGAILLGGKEAPVRAARVRGAAIPEAMNEAYARKYTSRANARYVEGFREPRRMAASLELTPG